MWTCPHCGRQFKRKNQSHFCGAPPENVSEYIKKAPPTAQKQLEYLRQLILSACPEVEEGIAWHMPHYRLGKKSLSFYAGKQTISLYLGEDILNFFDDEVKAWPVKKSAVYFSYADPLPQKLITQMVQKTLS